MMGKFRISNALFGILIVLGFVSLLAIEPAVETWALNHKIDLNSCLHLFSAWPEG